MILFADTSAWIKLYLDEEGSDEMSSRVEGQSIALSVLLSAEVHAAFARHLREGLLSKNELDSLRSDFESDWDRVIHLELDAAVLARIPVLCEKHPLRGADAVHLSSALTLQKEGFDVLFMASDRRLLDAATGEGLNVYDPCDGPAEPAGPT